MSTALRPPAALRLLAVVSLIGLVLFGAHAIGDVGGSGAVPFFDDYLYNALELAGALACLWRGIIVERERLAWLAVGAGLACWSLGDLYWSFGSPASPGVADVLYTAFYLCSYVGLVLLVRSRITDISRSAWLDGAIAALAAGSVVGAVAFPHVLSVTDSNATAVAFTLAYPIGDVILLSLVVGVMGLSRWRAGASWLLIGLGMALSAVGDVIYLVQTSKGTYVSGGFVDLLWPVAVLLCGLAAWQPPGRPRPPRAVGRRVVLVPTLGTVIALGLMVYDHFHRIDGAALALTVLTLLTATLRMALAFAENQRLLAASREEALTDTLTGLRNRRALMHDLEHEVAAATLAEPRAVLLFDLNGFKQYNDTFGHPAGDSLLARLGSLLGEAMKPYGCAYRLGGDEFCALVRPGGLGIQALVTLAEGALADSGEGFEVSAASGTCLVPVEADVASETLQLADRRMYARKGGSRDSVTRQTRDVLLRTLREREPDLHEHLHGVAELAVEVGQRLDMSSEQLDELARAAELHDIGKVAIPDAILNKPGPLDRAEWVFMHRHTIIGERILGAAPALRPVAKLVRASHERWDGEGYPDGLAGEEIPLGARIVAACDAYHAMTSDRPYRAAMTPDEALAELKRGAGSQFDPSVVEAFIRTGVYVELAHHT